MCAGARFRHAEPGPGAHASATVRLRSMTSGDVPAVLAVQEPGAIRALAAVFPQDEHPFPREDVASRWSEEIPDPGIDCAVVLLREDVVGFAAVRGDELLHLGIAVEHWGTEVSDAAHDAVLGLLRRRGVERTWLKVFAGNARARRFYERHGWRPTGERTWSTFPPHPELLLYERSLTGADQAGFCHTSR
ncbi:N-acetyltransferase family protein [Blastococcus sp. SYSU D01042]